MKPHMQHIKIFLTYNFIYFSMGNKLKFISISFLLIQIFKTFTAQARNKMKGKGKSTAKNVLLNVDGSNSDHGPSQL